MEKVDWSYQEDEEDDGAIPFPCCALHFQLDSNAANKFSTPQSPPPLPQVCIYHCALARFNWNYISSCHCPISYILRLIYYINCSNRQSITLVLFSLFLWGRLRNLPFSYFPNLPHIKGRAYRPKFFFWFGVDGSPSLSMITRSIKTKGKFKKVIFEALEAVQDRVSRRVSGTVVQCPVRHPGCAPSKLPDFVLKIS